MPDTSQTHCSLEAQIDCALEVPIAPCKLRMQPGGSDCSLEAQIAARRLRLEPGGSGNDEACAGLEFSYGEVAM